MLAGHTRLEVSIFVEVTKNSFLVGWKCLELLFEGLVMSSGSDEVHIKGLSWFGISLSAVFVTIRSVKVVCN